MQTSKANILDVVHTVETCFYPSPAIKISQILCMVFETSKVIQTSIMLYVCMDEKTGLREMIRSYPLCLEMLYLLNVSVSSFKLQSAPLFYKDILGSCLSRINFSERL